MDQKQPHNFLRSIWMDSVYCDNPIIFYVFKLCRSSVAYLCLTFIFKQADLYNFTCKCVQLQIAHKHVNCRNNMNMMYSNSPINILLELLLIQLTIRGVMNIENKEEMCTPTIGTPTRLVAELPDEFSSYCNGITRGVPLIT